MTNQNQFITIQDACIYSSKAEKTIRNLIKKVLVKNPDNTFTSKSPEKVLVKKEGKRFFYLVNKNFLDEHFNKKNKGVGESEENTTSTSTSNKNKTASKGSSKKEETTSQKYIDLVIEQQKEEIENLREQNKEKDRQIANFQERDREHNILIKDLQNQLTLPKPTTTEKMEQESDVDNIVDIKDENIPLKVKTEEPITKQKQEKKNRKNKKKSKKLKKEERTDKPKKGWFASLFS